MKTEDDEPRTPAEGIAWANLRHVAGLTDTVASLRVQLEEANRLLQRWVDDTEPDYRYEDYRDTIDLIGENHGELETLRSQLQQAETALRNLYEAGLTEHRLKGERDFVRELLADPSLGSGVRQSLENWLTMLLRLMSARAALAAPPVDPPTSSQEKP